MSNLFKHDTADIEVFEDTTFKFTFNTNKKVSIKDDRITFTTVALPSEYSAPRNKKPINIRIKTPLIDGETNRITHELRVTYYDVDFLGFKDTDFETGDYGCFTLEYEIIDSGFDISIVESK